METRLAVVIATYMLPVVVSGCRGDLYRDVYSTPINRLLNENRLDEAEDLCRQWYLAGTTSREETGSFLASLKDVISWKLRTVVDHKARRELLWWYLDLTGMQVAGYAGEGPRMEPRLLKCFRHFGASMIDTYGRLGFGPHSRLVTIADGYVKRVVGPQYEGEADRFRKSHDREIPRIRGLLKAGEQMGRMHRALSWFSYDRAETMESFIWLALQGDLVVFLAKGNAGKGAGFVLFDMPEDTPGRWRRAHEVTDTQSSMLSEECRVAGIRENRRLRGDTLGTAIVFERREPATGAVMLSLYWYDGELINLSADWGDLGGYSLLDVDADGTDEVVTWRGREPAEPDIEVYVLRGDPPRYVPAPEVEKASAFARLTAPPPPDPRLPQVDRDIGELLGVKRRPWWLFPVWLGATILLAVAAAFAWLRWFLARRRPVSRPSPEEVSESRDGGAADE